MEIIVL